MAVNKIIIYDPHGNKLFQGSFAGVDRVESQFVEDGGEQSVDSEYVNGVLTLTFRNLQGKVNDILLDGVSILGSDKVARIDSTGFGHVDDVKVNGQSVVSEKVANITVPTNVSELPNDADFATKSEAQAMANAEKITEVSVSVDGNVGTPSATVNYQNQQLQIAFQNILGDGIANIEQTTTSTESGGTNVVTVTTKGGLVKSFQVKNGEKGDTVILGEGVEYTLYNGTGSNTDGAMTQKAVTDALAQLSEEYVGVIETLKVGNDNIETKNTNPVGYRYYICCIKALGESKKIHLEGYMPEGAQWSFQGFSTLDSCRNINSSPIEGSESYSDSIRVFEFTDSSVKYFRLAFKRDEGNLTADQIGQINENTKIYISEASVESAFEAYTTVNGKIVYPVSDADYIKYNGSTTVKNELDEHKESIQSLKNNSCFAKEYALSEMTASTPATSRRRYTVRVPSVPVQADIIGVLPSGFNFGLQCNYSLEDAASSSVLPPQQTSWDVHSYYFTAENAYYITIGVKKSNNGNFSESDIETLESSTVKLSLRNFKASESEGGGIIGLNKDAERYLKNAKRPEYTGSSYTAMTTPFTLLHFSDIHGDELCLQRIVEFYTYYAQYIDDAICTGDVIKNIFGDSFDFWENAEAGNILNCTGNHEYYNGESSRPYYKIITQKQVYDKFFAPYIGEWGVTQPENAATNGLNYYYKDYTSNKVRLIVCDNMRVDTAQLNWLASVLADAITKDLHVIAAMHIGNPDEVQYNNAFNTLIPTTGHYTADQWLVDDAELLFDEVDTYIGNGGIFVGWIAGHKHLDTIGVQNGHPNQLIIHIATASSGNAWDIIPKADNCDRTNGTKSQDCFNIYSIDTYRKRIKIHRIGCDIDRDLRHKGNLCYDYENHQVIYVD